MKKNNLKQLVSTTLATGLLTIGANIIANDVTPGSWSAMAQEEEAIEAPAPETAEEGAEADAGGEEMACGEGSCG